MTKTFATFSELTSDLAFDVIDRLAGSQINAQFGKSNQSCSAYVALTILDEGGEADEDREFKLRFSDHADRYGSDLTIRIDDLIETTEEDGEYVATTIEDWKYERALERAQAAIDTFVARVARLEA